MLGFVKKYFKKPDSASLENAKKHLKRYLEDLKLHFDLSDDEILMLLSDTYCSNKPQNPFVKCFNMIKYWNPKQF